MNGLPDTPVGRRAAWLLDPRDGRDATLDDVKGLFSPTFLERVSPERILQAVGRYRTMGSSGIESIDARSPFEITLVMGPDTELCVDVRVEPDEPHRLTGLRSRPVWTRHGVLSSTPAAEEPVADVVARYVGPFAGRLNAGGVVVGVVRGDEDFVEAFGPVSPDALFEIGSVTKAFTGILLADMAGRDEVGVDDPVGAHLPKGTALPDEGITLLQLATHTSGLPRSLRPFIGRPTDPANPFAGLNASDLYTALEGAALERPPGSGYEYSNFGYILLGHVLSRAVGASYDELLAERICGPLQLGETMVGPGPPISSRRAAKYSRRGELVPPWDSDLAAPAGGLESTVGDMIRFVRSNLNPAGGGLGEALTRAQEERVKVDEHSAVAFGWHRVSAPDGSHVVWHNGGTGGFRTFVGLHQPSTTAVVVLCNENRSPDREAMQVLAALARTGPGS